MDTATWNAKLHQLQAAEDRSQRILRVHETLTAAVYEVALLELEHLAAQIGALAAECRLLAAIAEDRATTLGHELTDAHNGEESL
jgi:hypothetical protein